MPYELDRCVILAVEHLKLNGIQVPKETDWGYFIEKGNWKASNGVFEVNILGHSLDLRDRVLHERVLIITGDVPIRSHEEEDQEVVTNIGDYTVYQIVPPNLSNPIPIKKGQTTYSVNMNPDPVGEPFGFFHGFQVERGGVGLLYVAKALKPKFLDGNSFKDPKNTYNPESTE